MNARPSFAFPKYSNKQEEIVEAKLKMGLKHLFVLFAFMIVGCIHPGQPSAKEAYQKSVTAAHDRVWWSIYSAVKSGDQQVKITEQWDDEIYNDILIELLSKGYEVEREKDIASYSTIKIKWKK